MCIIPLGIYCSSEVNKVYLAHLPQGDQAQLFVLYPPDSCAPSNLSHWASTRDVTYYSLRG